MKLDNKVVIITGGNGLLGSAIVEGLKKEGAICINFDIKGDTSEDLGTIKTDITDEVNVEEAISVVISKYGRIDGLINNAYPRTEDWGNKFEDINPASWRTNVDWQLNSCFMLCQSVSKFMVKQGNGSIVNMSSIYGVVGPDFSIYQGTKMTMPAAYSAIKGGLVNFSRYLASYLGPHGVRVNVVSPGGIFDGQPESFVNLYCQKTPLRRMGLPDDIAPAVIFLLSEDSQYITGQNLIIDGGWTAI